MCNHTKFMQWLKRWAPHLYWFRIHAGFRGSFLTILGVLDLAYGAALIAATHSTAHWWPISVATLAGFPLHYWGGLWIVVGLYLFTGIFRPDDRWQYTAAVLIKSMWAGFATIWWITTGIPGGWGLAAIYTAFALSVLLVSAWPEFIREDEPPHNDPEG